MADTPTPESSDSGLPPLARQYVRYMVAFGVSLAVGLAPLLGKVQVPGFSALLSLYPVNLADTIIPFAALFMALPALGVQFYGGDRISQVKQRRWFARVLGMVAVLIVLMLAAYLFFVVQVPFDGGKGQAAFVVGFDQLPQSICVQKQLPLATCIAEELTFNPSAVEAIWPERELRLVKLVLSMGYLALMGSFGLLVGLLVLREATKANKAAGR